MSAAREAILDRIREALADVPETERPDDVPVDRAYRHADEAPPAEQVAQFIERVAEYKATVRRVAAANLPSAIAAACAARGIRRLAVPADLPGDWLPPGIEVLRDPGLTYEQLDQVDGVLTACALGIAQTGTIVLDGGAAQGRRGVNACCPTTTCASSGPTRSSGWSPRRSPGWTAMPPAIL